MELSETFWAGFYTFTGGFVLAVFAVAYKSKCDKVIVCWGMLDIHRNVEVELQEGRTYGSAPPLKELSSSDETGSFSKAPPKEFQDPDNDLP